jgi:ribosomal protein L19
MGFRTRLFKRDSPTAAHVGDVLLVRKINGEQPFAGVCINIRRRGIDTAILLRNQLTRVGVEMWIKVYSPLVEGIEIVQRARKRARRARLTFMRYVHIYNSSCCVHLLTNEPANLSTIWVPSRELCLRILRRELVWVDSLETRISAVETSSHHKRRRPNRNDKWEVGLGLKFDGVSIDCSSIVQVEHV